MIRRIFIGILSDIEDFFNQIIENIKFKIFLIIFKRPNGRMGLIHVMFRAFNFLRSTKGSRYNRIK